MAYAHRYAFTRNPAYGAFDEIGGDCANFVSQCLFAGGYPVRIAADGWYYRSFDDRAPASPGAHKKVIPEITIMASVRRDW